MPAHENKARNEGLRMDRHTYSFFCSHLLHTSLTAEGRTRLRLCFVDLGDLDWMGSSAVPLALSCALLPLPLLLL